MNDFAEHLFQTAVAITRARTEQLRAAETTESHWIEFDAPHYAGHCQRALCGDLVPSSSFSTQPTCRACQERMADVEAWAF